MNKDEIATQPETYKEKLRQAERKLTGLCINCDNTEPGIHEEDCIMHLIRFLDEIDYSNND